LEGVPIQEDDELFMTFLRMERSGGLKLDRELGLSGWRASPFRDKRSCFMTLLRMERSGGKMGTDVRGWWLAGLQVQEEEELFHGIS
jgi:hypothetical protein